MIGDRKRGQPTDEKKRNTKRENLMALIFMTPKGQNFGKFRKQLS